MMEGKGTTMLSDIQRAPSMKRDRKVREADCLRTVKEKRYSVLAE